MTVKVGDKLPSVELLHSENSVVTPVDIAQRTKGRRVVLFGLPGAYTSICSSAHLPSFIRTADAFRAKGVDEIFCVSVNDSRVMEHWDNSAGASEAGITMLADWDSELTKALGLEFTVPAAGFKDRMTRCSMLIEDGEVKVLQFEEDHGTCNLTAGETLLEML
ncbi:peroxiredoxin [Rhodobacteraceae bacterium]|nr:peroxiredoxin [Paracoccaceae bacterium]